MSDGGLSYQFCSMTASDLPMLQRWLETPEVLRWWGDAEEQFGLVCEDLDNPAMAQFIVTFDRRPFAYLQCFDLSAWPDEAYGTQPAGTRAIDQFIGVPDMINRGHGSAFIRMFVSGVLAADVPRVITDPDPENGRAIRAYEKAGFSKERVVFTQTGRDYSLERDAGGKPVSTLGSNAQGHAFPHPARSLLMVYNR